MPAYYLDASAAVKAYSEEEGADRVDGILDSGSDVYLSRVGVVEVAAAFFGRARTGQLREEDALSALEEFGVDLATVYEVVEVEPVTADRAVEIARRHRLRAYDCLQLATALLLDEQRRRLGLSPLVLVSSDGELNGAASQEGLAVEDPAR